MSPRIEQATFNGTPVVLVHMPKHTLVFSPHAFAAQLIATVETPHAIEHYVYQGESLVDVALGPDVLRLTEAGYLLAQRRGKAFRRWQAAVAQLARNKARKEAAQLAWIAKEAP